MAWESYSVIKCNKCNHIYEVENNTFTISQNDFYKCPLCHSEGTVISSRSMLDVMQEHHNKFTERKKRILF